MKKSKNRGITLVALVVTIIILLILAGVAIGTLTQNGLFENVKQAKNTTENAQMEEDKILGKYENKINESLEGISGSRENKNTLIKVYLDGEEIEDLPDKSLGYIVSEITCTNGASAEYSYSTGKIKISDISTTKIECIIKFESTTPYSKLVQNIENVEELTKLFNTEGFTTNVLKIKECRELLYDNYQIMEPILANSNIAQEEMKKSEQYEVISKTGQNKTFYNAKAFVLGFSCRGGSYSDYNAGNFLSGNFKWNPSNYYSTTGLSYKVNKFASKVSINGVYGVSINWENPMYVALIKI